MKNLVLSISLITILFSSCRKDKAEEIKLSVPCDTTRALTTFTVQVRDFVFDPSALNVRVGDTIKWVWQSGFHSTTSGSIPAGAASWDIDITSPSTTYSYVVPIAGTYNYKCKYHENMGMVASFTACQ